MLPSQHASYSSLPWNGAPTQHRPSKSAPNNAHVNMSRLGQQPFTLHQQTQLPRRPPLFTLALVNHHTVEQASPTDNLDHGRIEGFQAVPKDLAQTLGPLCKLFSLEHFECRDGHCAAQGVAAVGGAVFAGLDAEHDFFACEYARDGVHCESVSGIALM